MTILSSDIKLRASERMTDTTDGGGRRTLNVIADGVAGNVFPKVSRVDSVYGRVNLRKVFGHVDTPSGETYAGAHFVVTDAPDNDRIHVTAFSTGSDYDNRTAARDRIESYVISGPESRMVVYGRQLVGVQALLVYQRVEEPLPEIGEVYVISNETGGITVNQQFVAVQDMAHEVRTFTDMGGEFDRRVVTLTIGAPLRYEFVGFETPSRVSGSPSGAKFRSTTVADAARYFGIQPLKLAGVTNDLTLTVDSVYTPIVPTTQRETPLSVVGISGALAQQPVGAEISFTQDLPHAPNLVNHIFTKRGIVPGSMTITAPSIPPSIWKDDSAGKLINTTIGGLGLFLTVDYESGKITSTNPAGAATGSAPMTVYYTPAASVSQPAHTREIEITLGTRGTVYTPVLIPLPAPGSLIIDYRALGKWYRLRDDGTGELSGGDAAYGTGTVNYVTGGCIITLGALPDVGSSVLLSWGSPVHYEIRTNDSGNPYHDFVLPNVPITKGSFAGSYVANGVTYPFTGNTNGVISGSGTVGTIDHVTGEVHLGYTIRVPDFDSLLSIVYVSYVIDPVQPDPVIISGAPAIPGTIAIPPSVSNSLVKSFSSASTVGLTFNMGEPVAPGSFSASVRVSVGLTQQSEAAKLASLILTSLTDGTVQGKLVFDQNGNYTGAVSPSNIGTINHATGAVTIQSSTFVRNQFWMAGQWMIQNASPVSIVGVTGGANNFNFSTATVTIPGTPGSEGVPATPDIVLQADSLVTIDTLHQDTLSIENDIPVKIKLLNTSTSTVVANSVMFDALGERFIDRNGTLYSDIDQTTGVGMAAGSINYETSEVSLLLWTRGALISKSVSTCLTKFGNWTATDAFFRTVGSPIRPASLFVQVTADDGTLITGLADQNGIITGTYMIGKVEQTMGVVRVAFGETVTAAGKELEPWYDAANVVGGMIWQPKSVQPDTLRYSSVVVSNLPLNADILGLDPVRLPSDGRVPIYRSADVVVVHNTLSHNAGTPTASQVINVGRTNLAALWLEDANKLKLPLTKYATNLDAGTVTMAADLSLTGYVTPIAVKHRIEEMSLLSDVQINGQITLSAPLLRDYPLGSFVSSALLFGDMFSRVTGVFDQATWTSVWSNALIGSQATAQYNDVDYPITVLNNAAVTDRWRINFTSATAFQVISENMGVIASGTTAATMAPVNPLTSQPYFTLQAAGWGSGWAVGNQLRFNTIGAAAPIWLARTVLPGATLAGDSFDAQLRGDVD